MNRTSDVGQDSEHEQSGIPAVVTGVCSDRAASDITLVSGQCAVVE